MNDSIKSSIAGIGTGVLQTILFHPTDRALYLHMINKNKLFCTTNWTNPYHGISNSLFSKCINYGYYFTILEKCTNVAKIYLTPVTRNEFIQSFAIGATVGGTTSIINNPISIVKYIAWSTNDPISRITKQMYNTHGLKAFYKGLGSTFHRDSIFTTIYSFMKPHTKHIAKDSNVSYPKALEFILNTTVTFVATVISSPLNYSRNMQYKAAMDMRSLGIIRTLRDLEQDVIKIKGFVGKFNCTMVRLGVGWGTLRTAVGTGCGQFIYDIIYEHL